MIVSACTALQAKHPHSPQVMEFNRGHVEYIIATDEALNAAVASDGSGSSAVADGEDEEAEGSSNKKQKGKKTITKDKE